VPLLLTTTGDALAQGKRTAAQDPAPAPAKTAAAEKRIAVVIGNARYPAIPLNNPENDARVVAATLRKLGFEVTEHVNLPVKRFRQVLRDYVRRLQNESGVGLFYSAGHGVQIDGRNYLLPVDINLRDEEEIKDEAVDIDDLFMSKLSRAKTRGLIIILDACRDNPFRNKTRNIQATGGLAEMGVAGAFIGYSAAPGATAEDGPADTNSVFTRHLVKEMLTPGVEIETTFKTVRLRVLEETRRRQMPWSNTSLTIDFHFNPVVADGRADATKQADLARLQAMLERRESEQRKLEEELEAARRELRRQQPVELAPPAEPPPGAASAPANGVAPAGAPAVATAPPRATPSEVRHSDRQFEPSRVEPALPPRIEPSPVRTEPAPPAGVDSAPPARADVTAPRSDSPAAPVPVAEPPGTPKPDKGKSAVAKAAPREAPRPADSQVAQRSQAAKPARGESERCVELQVRASLGEPVPTAELQKECRR
jgi:uncharacterized caspase-like protein